MLQLYLTGLVEGPVNTFMLSAVVLCIASVVVIALCVWCHHRKRRRRRRHLARLRRNTVGSSRRSLGSTSGSRRQHVCDELGERFASVDSV
ncbi:hypothetical protein PR048_023692 [Dryococelus australis]|uniref:Uncharacterized protein n=1 Tax=Dryococelus australis TaxID=614101 RepID=A0ABQ9GUW2_9NEOP|nr:hypothetical protein PR048_023692 [Dryococelus australis]